MFKKLCWILIFNMLVAASFAAAALPANVQHFISTMHQQHGFSIPAMQKILSQQKPDAGILKIERRPYQHKAWPVFRDQLVTAKRIQEGVDFFRQHRKVLLQAQQKYHVDPYVITAIIGFESTYGKNAGHYHALHSLYTLGFYYPPREKYFQKELASLFLLARDWHKPVGSIISSFDGGLGYPQFMPDMYRKIAVAYQPNAFPDLIHSANDTIFSIARYLHQAHWQPNSFIAMPLAITGQVATPDCTYQKVKLYHAESLLLNGFVLSKKFPSTAVGCVQLPDNGHVDYWAFGDNFYAIQKYNHQIYYVLVVDQLSKAIHRAVVNND